MPILTSFISSSAAFIATTAAGRIVDLIATDAAGPGYDCIYSRRIPLVGSDRHAGRLLIDIPLRGEVTDTVAEFHADCGGSPLSARQVASFEFDGPLPHMPLLRIFAPHAHNLTLTLRGRFEALACNG